MILNMRLNCALRGYKVGDIIAVEADNEGVPVDSYWRRRIIDSKYDKCVELVENPKKCEVKNERRRNSNS